MNVLDYNGDGVDDLLVGAPLGPTGGYVDVYYGPLTHYPADHADLRLFSPPGTPYPFVGDGIHYGDINADGTNDLILLDWTWRGAYCLFGLE